MGEKRDNRLDIFSLTVTKPISGGESARFDHFDFDDAGV